MVLSLPHSKEPLTYATNNEEFTPDESVHKYLNQFIPFITLSTALHFFLYKKNFLSLFELKT